MAWSLPLAPFHPRSNTHKRNVSQSLRVWEKRISRLITFFACYSVSLLRLPHSMENRFTKSNNRKENWALSVAECWLKGFTTEWEASLVSWWKALQELKNLAPERIAVDCIHKRTMESSQICCHLFQLQIIRSTWFPSKGLNSNSWMAFTWTLELHASSRYRKTAIVGWDVQQVNFK